MIKNDNTTKVSNTWTENGEWKIVYAALWSSIELHY